MGREYDKLVRDDVPDVIDRAGETPVVHTADEAEYERRLLEKLDEEVTEFRDDRNVEELADVVEVVHAIRAHYGITEERLERVRSEKANARGRFEDRIVLERVDP